VSPKVKSPAKVSRASATTSSATTPPAAATPASAPDAPASSVGIALRPEIDPEVLAIVAAAVDQAWPRPRVVLVEEEIDPPSWRFSGRWWTRRAASRRSRPWS
jgi:hypothetical protein